MRGFAAHARMPPVYIIHILLSLIMVEALCQLIDMSPVRAIQKAIARRRALSPTERERLFALENELADRAIAAAETGDLARDGEESDGDEEVYEEVPFEDIRPGDWLVQSEEKLFVCAAPVKRGRSLVLVVEHNGCHMEIVGRPGQAWAVQRAA